jgi:hypothetical protein
MAMSFNENPFCQSRLVMEVLKNAYFRQKLIHKFIGVDWVG